MSTNYTEQFNQLHKWMKNTHITIIIKWKKDQQAMLVRRKMLFRELKAQMINQRGLDVSQGARYQLRYNEQSVVEGDAIKDLFVDDNIENPPILEFIDLEDTSNDDEDLYDVMTLILEIYDAEHELWRQQRFSQLPIVVGAQNPDNTPPTTENYLNLHDHPEAKVLAKQHIRLVNQLSLYLHCISTDTSVLLNGHLVEVSEQVPNFSVIDINRLRIKIIIEE